MDRHTSPAPTQDSDTPGRPSLASIIPPSRASSQATARDNAPTPRLLPSDAGGNDDHHPKPPREAPALRYRRTPFWLAFLYLTTLVVPWVLMCILNKQPLTAPSYYYQKSALSAKNFLAVAGVLAFINVLRAISGVIVVPITSIILAHAAVVYSQRRRHEQELNMRQLFALADRGWADLRILWECRRQGSSSRLLWLGALLLLLGGIQQPLQSLLVSSQPTVILTCLDSPVGECSSMSTATTIGLDAEPWAMARTSHTLVTEDVSNSLISVSDVISQEYLWVDQPYATGDNNPRWDVPADRSMLYYYGSDNKGEKTSPGSAFFVTSLLNRTSTGVLREHALRLNSSITCDYIPRSEYPSTCPGERPLATEIDTENVELRICAPGEVGRHPWSRTRNREDIEEELYIDFQLSNELWSVVAKNFTMRCTSATSRGYFELGNVMNQHVYGPLMDEWPDPETIENDSMDYLSDWSRPEETDHVNLDSGDDSDVLPFYRTTGDAFGAGNIPVSGPLMTSATALFGNNSFLQLVSDNATSRSPGQTLAVLCEHGGLPFSQVIGIVKFSMLHQGRCRDVPSRLPFPDFDEYAATALEEVVASWFSMFEETWDAEYLLEISMFAANSATLSWAIAGAGPLYAREIFHSPGTLFSKPSMTLAGVILISVLMLLQVVGLAVIVWYVNTAPTWAASLDAMAMARIGRAMRDGELPPIGPLSKEDWDGLRGVDALVGIGDREQESPGPWGPAGVSEDQPAPDRPLMDLDNAEEGMGGGLVVRLGAKGLITRDVVSEKPSWIGMRRRREKDGGV